MANWDSHRDSVTTGEELGEATGGISGALVGAGIGSAVGPVGTLIGGVAGAIGGWWAGRAVADSAAKLTREDDEYFREHYETQPIPPADLGYDAVRGAYYLGHIASNHPELGEGEWSMIEPELERGWTAQALRFGGWPVVSEYVRAGFERGRSRLNETSVLTRREHALGEDAERRE